MTATIGCAGFLLPNTGSPHFLNAFLIIFRLLVNIFSGLNLSLPPLFSLQPLFAEFWLSARIAARYSLELTNRDKLVINPSFKIKAPVSGNSFRGKL